MGRGDGLIEKKIGGDQAALNGIHSQAELLKNGEAEKGGVSGLAEDDATGDGLSIDSHLGFADVSLGPPSIRQHERDLADFLDAEALEDGSRDHGEGCARIRKSGNLL